MNTDTAPALINAGSLLVLVVVVVGLLTLVQEFFVRDVKTPLDRSDDSVF